MITLDDIKRSTLREYMHLNGGGKFFGYGYRGIEYPRLARLIKYWKKDRSTTIEWFVDGNPIAKLEDAVDLLNKPPVLSEAELAELRKVTMEYADLRKVLSPEALFYLPAKGVIEARDGKCRLTDLGIAALEAAKAGT